MVWRARRQFGFVLATTAVVGFGVTCGGNHAASAIGSRVTGAYPSVQELRRPFSGRSVWNTPVPDSARPTKSSRRLVAGLASQVRRFGATICTTAYSTPVYRVGRTQPIVRVRLDRTVYPGTSPYALEKAFRRVPIPPDARPAAGTDGHMVVWQQSTDTMWEFWRARLVRGHWYASWGGRIRHLSTNPGYYDGRFHDWGATATSLPLLGGLMMEPELQHDHINHALAMAVPVVTARRVVWPAQRSDGGSHARSSIPEGTRFRIRPDVDLESLHLNPPALAIAEAAQRYGMIVRDGGASVAFYAEAPKAGQANPYAERHGPFQGLAPWQIVSQFPWDDLQVVRSPTS